MGRVVRWWDHRQARAEEDGGWVREGRGSHEIGQRRQVRAAGGSGGRLGGTDGVGDWRQLAVGGTSIESMWAASSKKKHQGGRRTL